MYGHSGELDWVWWLINYIWKTLLASIIIWKISRIFNHFLYWNMTWILFFRLEIWLGLVCWCLRSTCNSYPIYLDRLCQYWTIIPSTIFFWYPLIKEKYNELASRASTTGRTKRRPKPRSMHCHVSILSSAPSTCNGANYSPP